MAFAKRRFLVSTQAAIAARYSFFLFRIVRCLIFSRSETTAYFRPKQASAGVSFQAMMYREKSSSTVDREYQPQLVIRKYVKSQCLDGSTDKLARSREATMCKGCAWTSVRDVPGPYLPPT